jgi:hypothetical protein
MACALLSTGHWRLALYSLEAKSLIEQVEQTKLGFVLRRIFSNLDQATLDFSACRVYLQVLDASVAWDSGWVLG